MKSQSTNEYLGPRLFRRTLRRLTVISTGLVLAAANLANAQQPSSTSGAVPDSIVVTVLHSNDVYGRLGRTKIDSDRKGGMAPRLHLLREISASGPTLILDAGNALGPGPVSALDKGTSMIDLMSEGGYEALLPASHEMDFGIDVLKLREQEATFPFVATNVQYESDGSYPFDRIVLKNVGGIKIGILGVVSAASLQDTDPRHLEGMLISDPIQAAAVAVDTLVHAGARYIIALSNMDIEATQSFAAAVPGINLVIAGGHRPPDREGHTNVLTRLVNGVEIVTTPRYGSFLGQVDIHFVRHPGDVYRPVNTDAFLHTVDHEVPNDPRGAYLVAQAESTFQHIFQDTLGIILDHGREAQALLVAHILRLHGESEIGILNLGQVNEVVAGVPLIHHDINRLELYPVTINTMKIIGTKIKQLVARSNNNLNEDRRLIFAGMDTANMTIAGQPLNDKEFYDVATVDFLARGGDGYSELVDNPSLVETGVSLRDVLVDALRERETLSHEQLNKEGHTGVWYSSWLLDTGFERNYVDDTTAAYQEQNEALSYLNGFNTVSWNFLMRYILQYQSGPHTMRFDNRMDLAMWGTSFSDLSPFADQVDSEATYRYGSGNKSGAPFLSLRLNSAFGKAGHQSRPLQLFSAFGFEFRPSNKLSLRLGARQQHNFVVERSDLGGEFRLEWHEPLHGNSDFSTQIRGFVAATDRRTVSLENYNTISFSVLDRFRLNIRQSNFLLRVNDIPGASSGDFAFRTYLTVGIGYGLNWKWR